VSNDSICYGDTVLFYASPAGNNNYAFYDNGVLLQSGPSELLVTASLDSNSIVTVFTTNLGCLSPVSNDTSLYITYGPGSALTSSDADSTICLGDSVVFTALPLGLTSYTFFVNESPVQSGASNTYTTNGLQDNDSITVAATDLTCPGIETNPLVFTVNPIPQVVLTNPSGTICAGDISDFIAAPSGMDNYTFYINGIVQASDTSSLFTTNLLTSGDSITAISTNLGCTSLLSNELIADVNPLPTLNYFVDTVCEGNSTLFTDSSWTNITTRYWSFGDGDSSYGSTVQHLYLAPGTYTASLAVTDANGCINSNAFDVIIRPKPIADFNATPQTTTILNPTVAFTDMSLPPYPNSIISWEWDFDDGSPLEVTQHSQHEYQDTGVFQTALIVTNQYNCTDIKSLSIVIEPEFVFLTPNSFTPNGDGLNDDFVPKGIGIDQDFEMHIYNRWGDLIFSSFSLNQPWKGYANNGSKIVPEDVYVWKIRVRDHQQRLHEFIGHITLIQ
jgi:gliding motility-associated-like protein